MGGGDKCCVGGCNNDRRYPDRYVIRSHVNKLGFHKPSKSEDVIRSWCIQVQKGRKEFKIGKSRESVIVCSNHFVDGKPTRNNPIPTLFLTPFEHSKAKSPHKRRKLEFSQNVDKAYSSIELNFSKGHLNIYLTINATVIYY